MPEPKPELLPVSAAAERREAAEPRVLTSEALLQGGREVIIRHGSDDYRLRLTRVGKLILNK